MIIKTMSWNIHKCVGTDRLRSSNRILETIKELNPDIAFLQEVDRKVGNNRATLSIDEIKKISGLTPVMIKENKYKSLGWHGNLLLVKPEIICLNQINIKLPSLEPRGAVIWELQYNGVIFDAVGMHLGLLGLNRRHQIGTIASLIAARPYKPVIIAGDTNEWWAKSGEFIAVEDIIGSKSVRHKTFPANNPILALDKTIAGKGAYIIKQEVIRGLKASDHLPLLTEIKIDVV